VDPSYAQFGFVERGLFMLCFFLMIVTYSQIYVDIRFYSFKSAKNLT